MQSYGFNGDICMESYVPMLVEQYCEGKDVSWDIFYLRGIAQNKKQLRIFVYLRCQEIFKPRESNQWVVTGGTCGTYYMEHYLEIWGVFNFRRYLCYLESYFFETTISVFNSFPIGYLSHHLKGVITEKQMEKADEKTVVFGV